MVNNNFKRIDRTKALTNPRGRPPIKKWIIRTYDDAPGSQFAKFPNGDYASFDTLVEAQRYIDSFNDKCIMSSKKDVKIEW